MYRHPLQKGAPVPGPRGALGTREHKGDRHRRIRMFQSSPASTPATRRSPRPVAWYRQDRRVDPTDQRLDVAAG
jgi:hypothetical protein